MPTRQAAGIRLGDLRMDGEQAQLQALAGAELSVYWFVPGVQFSVKHPILL